MIKQEGEPNKPRVRIVQPDGPVELKINGRVIDVKGQCIDGIWFTEPAELATEAQEVQEARRTGIELWSQQFVHPLGMAGFVSVTDNDGFGDEYQSTQYTANRLLNRSTVVMDKRQGKGGVTEVGLGEHMTQTFVKAKLLLMDPTDIAAMLKEVEENDEVGQEIIGMNAAELLDPTLIQATRSMLPSRLETLSGSIPRAEMANRIHGAYLLWVSRNF